MLMKYIANEPRRVELTSRERRTAKCHWNYRHRQRRAAGAGRAGGGVAFSLRPDSHHAAIGPHPPVTLCPLASINENSVLYCAQTPTVYLTNTPACWQCGHTHVLVGGCSC